MGFLSMVWAVQSRFEEAGTGHRAVRSAGRMDGKVARLTHTASEFGVQYDSPGRPHRLRSCSGLPALAVAAGEPGPLRRGGGLPLCRLRCPASGPLQHQHGRDRQNVSSSGCPLSPPRAARWWRFLYFAGILPESSSCPPCPIVSIIIALGLGVLMVSRVRYFSFKEYDFLRAHPGALSAGRHGHLWPGLRPGRACSASCSAPSTSVAASTTLSLFCPVVTVSYYAPWNLQDEEKAA